jgi:hypothetical protein
MNLDTVLMCAQMTARQQIAALGYVDADVQALIDEVESLLVPDAVVEEAPVAKKTSTAKK